MLFYKIINRKSTLSPSRRLMPSSSIKAEVCKVVSCMSSSLFPFGERRHQDTTNPRELFPLWPSNVHFNNMLRPDSSAMISGTDGDGGCISGKRKGELEELRCPPVKCAIKMYAQCIYVSYTSGKTCQMF